MENIGKRIALLRENKNHTRYELAEYLNVTPKVVYNIEHGITHPTVEIAIKICDRYKVTLEWLILGMVNAKQ
jgi:transcriptional regulator with XRE-family HTH domain